MPLTLFWFLCQKYFCRQEFPFFGGVQLDIAQDHVIIVSDGKLILLDKMTGEELYKVELETNLHKV